MTPFLSEVTKTSVVKPSLIEGAGMGLFAGMDLPADTIVMYYEGVVLSEEQYERLAAADDTEYVLYIWNRGVYVDGKDPNTSQFKTRFLNHSCAPKANLKWGDDGALVTLRPIKKGEEMYVDYGSDYWTPEETAAINNATIAAYNAPLASASETP
eukprot:TRINITY_DN4294_c0_g1_i9.p1 TRINITY_DN4294_c0_g1~~TRINITY_DN4294_c0_g1_i9.p1  ORF type:complete len:174 (-),score=55.42 TRINITY_DN4294_c0_g1_i9:455-919(-)